MSDRVRHEEISTTLVNQFGTTPAWPSVQPCREGFDPQQRHLLWFFPVDNTKGHKDPIIRALMQTVEDLARKEDYIHKKVVY